MTAIAATPTTIRKKLVRRAAKDRSQTLRHAFQLAFLALNVWIGVEFYLFVRFYETGGRSTWAGRPPGVEGWLIGIPWPPREGTRRAKMLIPVVLADSATAMAHARFARLAGTAQFSPVIGTGAKAAGAARCLRCRRRFSDLLLGSNGASMELWETTREPQRAPSQTSGLPEVQLGRLSRIAGRSPLQARQRRDELLRRSRNSF